MAICVSAFWRGTVKDDEPTSNVKLSPDQWEHFHAFKLCVAVADRNIRRHAGPREVANIVAEDHPEMRRFLRFVPRILKLNPVNIGQDGLRKTVKDEEAGYIDQSGDLGATRMRNSIHFVDKNDDPVVQIADACAYGFRIYFAKEKFGIEFVRSILGNENHLRAFGPPCGAECFWPKETSILEKSKF